MKKLLLSFILSVAAFAPSYADGYTGILVDNGTQKTYYLFSEQPTVKYQQVEGVMNACLFAEGGETPVVSVPLQNGAKLSVCYDAFVRVNLNSEGYATFSAKDASFIATEGVTAYKAAVDGELITLTALEGNIPAATGVLLYGETPNAKVNLPVATFGSDADVDGNSLMPTTLADGSLAQTEANSWVLGNDNAFHKFSQSSAYKANRAYLVHEQATGAKAMRMVFEGEDITGLDNVAVKADALEGKYLENGNIIITKNGKKYNLAGQVIE